MIEGSLMVAREQNAVPVNKIHKSNRLKNRIVMEAMFLNLGGKDIYKTNAIYLQFQTGVFFKP
jgi:hypothetical protein